MADTKLKCLPSRFKEFNSSALYRSLLYYMSNADLEGLRKRFWKELETPTLEKLVRVILNMTFVWKRDLHFNPSEDYLSDRNILELMSEALKLHVFTGNFKDLSPGTLSVVFFTEWCFNTRFDSTPTSLLKAVSEIKSDEHRKWMELVIGEMSNYSANQHYDYAEYLSDLTDLPDEKCSSKRKTCTRGGNQPARKKRKM
jgi:hypothetical protein